ncbi:WW domain-binding protein 4, partial [Fragariocoptes setiger]
SLVEKLSLGTDVNDRTHWDELLQFALFAMNTSWHSDLKASPNELVHGREPVLPGVAEPSRLDLSNTFDYAGTLKRKVAQWTLKAAENSLKPPARQAEVRSEPKSSSAVSTRRQSFEIRRGNGRRELKVHASQMKRATAVITRPTATSSATSLILATLSLVESDCNWPAAVSVVINSGTVAHTIVTNIEAQQKAKIIANQTTALTDAVNVVSEALNRTRLLQKARSHSNGKLLNVTINDIRKLGEHAIGLESKVIAGDHLHIQAYHSDASSHVYRADPFTFYNHSDVQNCLSTYIGPQYYDYALSKTILVKILRYKAHLVSLNTSETTATARLLDSMPTLKSVPKDFLNELKKAESSITSKIGDWIEANRDRQTMTKQISNSKTTNNHIKYIGEDFRKSHIEATMSERWQSNQKRYCEFCSCWFADNKASIDFHERGTKHKANVHKKLSQLHQKNAEQAIEGKKYEAEMAKIEAAALAALEKDAAANPYVAHELSRVKAAQAAKAAGMIPGTSKR